MKKSTVKILISALIFAVLSAVFAFSAAAASFTAGDVDMDGVITAADARLSLRASVSLGVYTEAELLLCDATGDGAVRADDARLIIRTGVGLDSISRKVYISDEQMNENSGAGVDKPEISGVSGSFTFSVYGNGHGVGMSQWGAVLMDKGGSSYGDILRHYYSGIRLLTAAAFPEKTVYGSAGEQNTRELLARIVYNEIYGITSGGKYIEAVKAQTVAVFTLMKYYNFDISYRSAIGIASAREYSDLPANLRNAVDEVIGRYIARSSGDAPVLAVYSAMAAGKTASAQNVWGGALSYLVSVNSPYEETQLADFSTTVVFTAEELRKKIQEYSSDITLSANPAEWIEIIEHTASIDMERGYVTKIRVGNRLLEGNNDFCQELLDGALRSSCFTVDYTP